MDPRFVLGLALLITPFLPAVAAHAGQVDAASPCPDASVVWGHGHDAAGERFLWLDTHQESVHGPTDAAYWSPPADADNRTFALVLDPPLVAATALDEEGVIRIDVAGRAESATGPLLPGPVQTVIDVVLGTNEVPAEVKDALRAIRYTGLQNAGPADVTLQADLVAGGVVVASGQTTGVNTQPDDTLAIPPSPPGVEDVQPPEPPRDSPVDPPPVHTPGDRATFRATFELTPELPMLDPDEPLWLDLTRTEPLAWDLVLGGDDGLRVDLPIVDHPLGPLCPDWVVPPLNVTVDAPATATAAPGGSVDVTIGLENPARVAQRVSVAFTGGDYGVVRGTVDDAVEGVVTVGPYDELVATGSYQVADNALERTYRVTMRLAYNNTTLAFPTDVVVSQPEETTSTPPTEPSASRDAENASAPADDGSAPPAEGFDASDAGGNSPGPALWAVVIAVAAALAAVPRRR